MKPIVGRRIDKKFKGVKGYTILRYPEIMEQIKLLPCTKKTGHTGLEQDAECKNCGKTVAQLFNELPFNKIHR